MRTAATGRKLNLQSDARYRFERGLDPAFVGPGLEAATRLIVELCGGEPSAVAISGAVPEWRRRLRFRPDRTRELGRHRHRGGRAAPHPRRRSAPRLPSTPTPAWTVEPPSWRGDIEGEADLVEEVLRIHGYEHIPGRVAAARDGAAAAGARPGAAPRRRSCAAASPRAVWSRR